MGDWLFTVSVFLREKATRVILYNDTLPMLTQINEQLPKSAVV
jgi:hypothetical protein